MSIIKISQFPSIPSGSIDNTNDVLPLVNSLLENKKVSIKDLEGALTASRAISASYALSASYAPGTFQSLQDVTDIDNFTNQSISSSATVRAPEIKATSEVITEKVNFNLNSSPVDNKIEYTSGKFSDSLIFTVSGSQNFTISGDDVISDASTFSIRNLTTSSTAANVVTIAASGRLHVTSSNQFTQVPDLSSVTQQGNISLAAITCSNGIRVDGTLVSTSNIQRQITNLNLSTSSNTGLPANQTAQPGDDIIYIDSVTAGAIAFGEWTLDIGNLIAQGPEDIGKTYTIINGAGNTSNIILGCAVSGKGGNQLVYNGNVVGGTSIGQALQTLGDFINITVVANYEVIAYGTGL